MKENKEDCILLGADFNGRIGEKGARNWEQKGGKRKSKDKMENAEGKKLIEETRGRRMGMGLYSYQGGNSDRLSNRERKSMRKSRRIQNRGENRVGPSPGGNKYRRNEP
jgi:hypothetical protein